MRESRSEELRQFAVVSRVRTVQRPLSGGPHPHFSRHAVLSLPVFFFTDCCLSIPLRRVSQADVKLVILKGFFPSVYSCVFFKKPQMCWNM